MKKFIYLGSNFMIGFCDSRKKFILFVLDTSLPGDALWFEKLEIDMGTAGVLASLIEEKQWDTCNA